jgi:hypothetical protein
MLGTIIIAGWLAGYAVFAIEAVNEADARGLAFCRRFPWTVFAVIALWPVTRPLALYCDWRDERL